MMSDQSDKYINVLSPYGLSREEAQIYLILLQKGFLTALTISRELHMARTKVYRILDKLREKNLVEQKLDSRGLRFGATDPSKFKQLIVEKEHEVEALKDTLPSVLSHLAELSGKSNQKSKVLYYTGVDGLIQIAYNSTCAKTDLLTYESSNDMAMWTNKKDAEKIRQEFVNNKVHVKEITFNRTFSDWTHVTEFATKYWQARYIDPEKLSLNSEALIYDDVYVMYNYQEGFGVEIHNADIASMQRKLFEFIWGQAKPMKLLTPHGAAEVSI